MASSETFHDAPLHRDPVSSTPHGQILIILHQEQSSPGRIGRLLEEHGFSLDVRRPRFGDPLPDTMADHAGAVIFGGPMSANDGDEWIQREIDWISVPLAEGKPFLGVCLGGQLLARHLGETVYAQPDGSAEIGYYPIQPAPVADKLFAHPFPRHVYQWHREGFTLPEGATLLAKGELFHTQAFLYGDNAVALQFHPEVTYATMCCWTVKAHDRMQAPNAQTRQEQLDGWYAYDRDVALWLDAFLRTWIAIQPKGQELSARTQNTRPASIKTATVREEKSALSKAEGTNLCQRSLRGEPAHVRDNYQLTW